MPSVLDSVIYKTDDSTACWLIYENFRHHILNRESLEGLLNAKKVHKTVAVIPKSKLHEFRQGDSFSLI